MKDSYRIFEIDGIYTIQRRTRIFFVSVWLDHMVTHRPDVAHAEWMRLTDLLFPYEWDMRPKVRIKSGPGQGLWSCERPATDIIEFNMETVRSNIEEIKLYHEDDYFATLCLKFNDDNVVDYVIHIPMVNGSTKTYGIPNDDVIFELPYQKHYRI